MSGIHRTHTLVAGICARRFNRYVSASRNAGRYLFVNEGIIAPIKPLSHGFCVHACVQSVRPDAHIRSISIIFYQAILYIDIEQFRGIFHRPGRLIRLSRVLIFPPLIFICWISRQWSKMKRVFFGLFRLMSRSGRDKDCNSTDAR